MELVREGTVVVLLDKTVLVEAMVLVDHKVLVELAG